MPSMPGGDDKKEDDKGPETPEAKAEREQQVIFIAWYFCLSGLRYNMIEKGKPDVTVIT